MGKALTSFWLCSTGCTLLAGVKLCVQSIVVLPPIDVPGSATLNATSCSFSTCSSSDADTRFVLLCQGLLHDSILQFPFVLFWSQRGLKSALLLLCSHCFAHG